MGGASHEQDYPAKALEILNCFDINYGKLKDRMAMDIQVEAISIVK